MLEKYSELTAGMDFNETALTVGNGASISLSNSFNYNNLFLKAEELGYLYLKLQEYSPKLVPQILRLF